MTTVVQHARFSALMPPQSQAEIIDVDSIDDNDLPRPIRRRHPPSSGEVIVIDDDDDDILPVASSSRMISPPPPTQDAFIPPVPRVPSRYSALVSPPMRRHPPPHPVVAASTQLFAFEEGMRGSSSTMRSPPMRARPPVHRPLPTVNFGGALMNTRNTSAASSSRRRATSRRLSHAPPLAFANIDPMHMHLHEEFLHYQLYLATDAEWGRSRAKPNTIIEEADYKRDYTHPKAAEPGYTHDFAPPPAPEPEPSTFPSTSEANPIVVDDEGNFVSPEKKDESHFNTLLVCACCMNPLVIEGGGGTRGAEEERNNKVWSLRCGHVLDGKCLNKLAIPLPVLGGEDEKARKKGKGKGKAKAADAVALYDHVALGETSMRSRLRPRNTAEATPAPSGLMSVLPNIGSLINRVRVGKRKRTEEEYVWMCPVLGCGKVHVSVKIDDEPWKQDTEGGKGAIALYV